MWSLELIGWSRDREVDSSPLGIAIALWVYDHMGPAAYKALLSFIVTFYWLGAKKARGYSAEYLRILRSYMDDLEKEESFLLTPTGGASIPISTSGTTAYASWRRSSPGTGGSG